MDAIMSTTCNAVIRSLPTVKSLGVILNHQLRPTFDEHIASIFFLNPSSFTYVHCDVHNSLPDDVAKTVACSIIDFRLDYCNSLFVGMSVSD